MINKVDRLSEQEQKQFYKMLCKEITDIIGDFFSSEEELQEAFEEFMYDEEYAEVMDMVLADIAPDLGLTHKDLKRLKPKRMRLCRVCGSVFISYDYYNRKRICYSATYQRYISDDENGHFVKYTEEGQSECYAERRRQITKAYRQREKYAS